MKRTETRFFPPNLVLVSIWLCRGDKEQQPMQCGGTSFISAHLVCSHSSLTPLTDEPQRLVKLPADSALTHTPSAPLLYPSVATLFQHSSSISCLGGCKTIQPEVTRRTVLYIQAQGKKRRNEKGNEKWENTGFKSQHFPQFATTSGCVWRGP